MEKNCYLKEFRSEVNNPNLFEVVGGFECDFITSGIGEVQAFYAIDNSHPIKLKLPVGVTPISDNYISYDEATNTVVYTSGLRLSVQNTKLHCVLLDKYNIKSVNLGDGAGIKNTSPLKVCRNIAKINLYYTSILNNGSFDLSDFYQPVVTELNIDMTTYAQANITGNLNTWLEGCDASKLVTLNVKREQLIDEDTNIASLCGRFTALTTMGFHGVTRLKGTVENLVANQVAKGRTTCNQISIISGGTLGTNVTFNGAEFTGIVSAKSTLKWKPTTSLAEGAVTDICLNSTAITISANGTKIADATPW